jgi:hypothetical protein
MHYRENLPSEYLPAYADQNMAGLLDTLANIVGGGARILDQIRRGGQITISPPGAPAVTLDTSDPSFFDKLRQYIYTLKSAAGSTLSFSPNSGAPAAAMPPSGLFSGSNMPLLLGGGLLAFLLLRRPRRA